MLAIYSCIASISNFVIFFFNDTATTEIYTLSLHDALPISARPRSQLPQPARSEHGERQANRRRSEEHTSELQSQSNLVCRLLLEKKNRPSRVEERLRVPIAQQVAANLLRWCSPVPYSSASA